MFLGSQRSTWKLQRLGSVPVVAGRRKEYLPWLYIMMAVIRSMLSGTTISRDALKGKSILGHDSTHDAAYMWLWGHHVYSTSQGVGKAC